MGRLVGYGVSQVPTNGMLGGMAYQDPTNVSVNILRVGPPGGNFQPGNGTNASLAVSGIFTGSYTPSGPLLSLYAKATVLGIANDAGVTENNAAVIGFSCLNASGFNSQAYFGAVSSPESGGDFGRGAVLVWGRRSGGNYTESMRISRTGDVGIGSTQISTKLDVVQGTGGTDTLKLQNSSSNNVIRLQSANTFNNYIDFYSGASSGALIIRGAGTERVSIDSSGRFLHRRTASTSYSGGDLLNFTSHYDQGISANTSPVLNEFSSLTFDNLGTGNPVLFRLYAGMGGSPNGRLFEAYTGQNGSRFYISAQNYQATSIRQDKPNVSIEFGDTWTTANAGRSLYVMQNISYINGSLGDGANSLCASSVTLKPTWSGGTPSYRNATGYEAIIAANNSSANSVAFYADVTGASTNWALYANNGRSYLKDTVLVGSTSTNFTNEGNIITRSQTPSSTSTAWADQITPLGVYGNFGNGGNSQQCSSALTVYGWSSNGSGNAIIRGWWSSVQASLSTPTLVFQVASSGNVTNTNNSYGSLSDIRYKQDVTNADSQWDDIKNIKIKKFRFIEDVKKETEDNPAPYMIGCIAQEVAEVSPGLIEIRGDDKDEDGNIVPEVMTLKYSVLYMKAIKALQEAQERIEQLEAKVQALETK